MSVWSNHQKWEMEMSNEQTQVLIYATNASPEITVQDFEAIETVGQLQHWRDVIADCATQVGADKCKVAFRWLDRIEDELYSKQ